MSYKYTSLNPHNVFLQKGAQLTFCNFFHPMILIEDWQHDSEMLFLSKYILHCVKDSLKLCNILVWIVSSLWISRALGMDSCRSGEHHIKKVQVCTVTGGLR
jgi:hypothetical protein